jgi:hypothetical protein
MFRLTRFMLLAEMQAALARKFASPIKRCGI